MRTFLSHGARTATLAAAAVAVLPAPAFAHGTLAAGDFYTGLLQPVFHLNSLLPIVVVALWATQLGEAQVWRLPLVFMAAALLGGLGTALGLAPPATAWVLHGAMLLLGLLVAAHFRLPMPCALAIGLTVGLAHGSEAVTGQAETLQKPVLYVTGVCASIGLICFHLESLVLRFSAFWMQVAVRVLGSWIAAIGLLISVLRATGGGQPVG